MTRVIYLAPGQARCIGLHCKHSQPCARKEAPCEPGRPLTDYSTPTASPFVPRDCAAPFYHRFISLSQAVAPKQTQQPKEWIGQ